MTSMDIDTNQVKGSEVDPNRARWRRDSSSTNRKRHQVVAFACCILATTASVLLALSTLASPKPNAVLVSLYMLPPAEETLGVDAPYHPISDRLFDLTPVNVAILKAPSTESQIDRPASDPIDVKAKATETDTIQTFTPKDATPACTEEVDYRLTDWQEAVNKCAKSDELILHVSSFARIEHNQVVFFGRSDSVPTRVAFSDLLATVGRARARKSLVVLDVNWPMVSDQGDSSRRFEQLDRLIRDEFSKSAAKNTQLLMSGPNPNPVAGIVDEPRSSLCRVLGAAMESPESDFDHNGTTSVREMVQWASNLRDSSVNRRRIPTLSLIGSGNDFYFQRSGLAKVAFKRVYPEKLAISWKRHEQYLRSSEAPFLLDTASGWWSGLNDLEFRWLRGEPLPSINTGVKRLEEKCLNEILIALEVRRSGRSDSLTIAAERFPSDCSEEALRKAFALVNRHIDAFATIDAGGRDAVTQKLVAEYVANFPPEDAPLALNAVIRTIEQTTSLDAAEWDLICKVRAAFPTLGQFPIAQLIDVLANEKPDFNRFKKRLTLIRMRDQLGTKEDASVILSRSISKAFEDLANAEKVCESVGMTSDEVAKQFTMQALSAAEAVVNAERHVSNSLRAIDCVLLGLSIDDAFGLSQELFQSNSELIAATQHLLDLLDRVKQKSDANQTLPTMELAFLRQGSERIERLIARRSTGGANTNRLDPIIASTMVSALADPHERFLLIGNNANAYTSPTISLASLSVKSDQHSLKTDSRPINEWLEVLRSQLNQLKNGALKSESDNREVLNSNNIVKMSDAVVRVGGDLRKLSWDNPEASVELSLNPTFDGELPVKFRFLPPASSAIRVYPQSGELSAGQTQRILVSLCKQQDDSSQNALTGIWLQTMAHSGNSLTSLTMVPQPPRPRLDIDFGANTEVKGRKITIPMWPSNDPQMLKWHVASNDPSITAVVLTASSGNGISVASQPLVLNSTTSTLISFPPPKPGNGKEAIASLQSPIEIVATDPKDGGLIARWTVVTQVRDPRGYIQPGLAEYTVDDGGKNRLTVGLERLLNPDHQSDTNDFAPSIRLELESGQESSLIDFGNSRLQNTVTSDQSTAVLFAENLRFTEGEPPVRMIPISINGDKGYFELEGRFPRRAGTVKLFWDRQPKLRIRANAATAPGTALQATFESRNLDDHDELVVEVFNATDRQAAPLWQAELVTSRQIECAFESAGPNATFAVNAMRRDWNLAIPSDFGTGEYGLRAFVMHKGGKPKAFAEHRFMIDDGVPTNLQARADVLPDRTILNIACDPSGSGIKSLSVAPVALTSGDKINPLIAQPTDTAGSRWQLNWPAAIQLPERVELAFVTGAGKEFTTACELRTRKIVPVGRLVGQVLEGSIAQPQLTVTLRNLAGVDLAKYVTDDQGHFEFSVSPGQYQVATEKIATQRKATMQISVDQGELRKADLILQRSVSGGA